METIFSKILRGEIPVHKIYEDDSVLAFLDISPVAEGHTLVIPKNYYEDILSVPSSELAILMPLVQKVAGMVNAAYQPEKVMVATLGLDVAHLHFHLIPRWKHDGKVPLNGERATDEELVRVREKIVQFSS